MNDDDFVCIIFVSPFKDIMVRAVLRGGQKSAAPQSKVRPTFPPNAVSNGCIVQCLCPLLVSFLHLLMWY